MELIYWSGNSDLCWTRARDSGRAPARERIEGACEIGDLVDHGEEMVGPRWKMMEFDRVGWIGRDPEEKRSGGGALKQREMVRSEERRVGKECLR